MDVILLERVSKLGQMGDTVTVKDGYARNFLLPKGKALRANKANLARFESERAQLEARNLERKTEAEAIADKLNGNMYVAVRSAGETGQLYGSVAARDIAATLDENGFTVGRGQIELRAPIKTIGLHAVTIILHPDVESEITMNVARSEDEAVRQEAGEDLTLGADAADAEAEMDEPDLEEIFENPEDVDLGEETEVKDEAGDDASNEEEVSRSEAEAKEDGEQIG